MGEWKRTAEELPPEGIDVLLNFTNNFAVGYWYKIHDNNTSRWYAYSDNRDYTSCDNEPTHWMSLPEPPKMDGGGE